MSTEARGQLAFDELVITDAALEAALEARAELREISGEARRKLEQSTAAVSALVEPYSVPDAGALRVGRFRIAKLEVKPRSVAFEVGGSSRLTITEVDEE